MARLLSGTILLAVERLPATIVAAFRDRLPADWSLVVLDSTGACSVLADARTRVLAEEPALGPALLDHLDPHHRGSWLLMSDDGLLVCPTVIDPSPPASVGEEGKVRGVPGPEIGLDPAPLPLTPALSPSRGRGSVFIASVEALPEGPVYGVGQATARPEHYLGPAYLSAETLARLLDAGPIRLDRWLGHVVALRLLAVGGRLLRLPAEWPALPSPVQWSGRDLHRSRLLAGPVLDMHAIPLPEAEWTDGRKATIDARLSEITRAALRHLPPADPRPAPPALPKSACLVIIKLDSIGDAVLATPFLRALRQDWSGEIRYLGARAARDIVEPCPYIDRTCFIGAGGAPLIEPQRGAAYLADILPQARAFCAGADAAIVLRPAVDLYFATQIAVLSGVPRVYGFAGREAADIDRFNRAYHAAFTEIVAVGETDHEAEAMGRMAAALGVGPVEPPCMIVTHPADHEAAAWRVEGRCRPFIGLGIGAQNPCRRWPIASYGALTRALVAEFGATVFALGGPDMAAAGVALARAGAVDLCGRTSLRETAALMHRLDLFIGNNSGPLHMAVAADTPVIEISCHPEGARASHDNAPGRFGPYGGRAIILQPAAPLSDACRGGCIGMARPDCVLTVSVEQVLAAVRRYEAIAG